jgi:hypothetical protein
MRIPIRALSWLLCASLLSPMGACDDKNLQQTEVPAGGVTLRYALAPGASFAGHVNQREAVQTPGGGMNRSLDFGVQLRVVAVDDRGTAAVEAVVDHLEITWALPPSVPYSLSEFIERATKKIDGVTIRFGVTTSGEVVDVPGMPADLDDQERLVLQGVLDGLTSAFFEVTDRSLEAGAEWTDQAESGREGKLGKHSRTTTKTRFEGLFDKVDTHQRVAKLVIESDATETMTTKAGGHEITRRSKTTALFDVQEHHLVSLQGTISRFDSGETTTQKFTAEWKKQAAGAMPVDTQEIDDPCHPDYVGPGECATQAPVDGQEVQEIDDPCHPDYVGPAECPAPPPGEAPAPAPKG